MTCAYCAHARWFFWGVLQINSFYFVTTLTHSLTVWPRQTSFFFSIEPRKKVVRDGKRTHIFDIKKSSSFDVEIPKGSLPPLGLSLALFSVYIYLYLSLSLCTTTAASIHTPTSIHENYEMCYFASFVRIDCCSYIVTDFTKFSKKGVADGATCTD